jgi:hypothetical protein
MLNDGSITFVPLFHISSILVLLLVGNAVRNVHCCLETSYPHQVLDSLV